MAALRCSGVVRRFAQSSALRFTRPSHLHRLAGLGGVATVREPPMQKLIFGILLAVAGGVRPLWR